MVLDRRAEVKIDVLYTTKHRAVSHNIHALNFKIMLKNNVCERFFLLSHNTNQISQELWNKSMV